MKAAPSSPLPGPQAPPQAGSATLRRRLKRCRRRVLAALASRVLPRLVRLWRRSLRVSIAHDPRPALRAHKVPYVFALLHSQQVTALLAHDEPAPVALVSRSRDGSLLSQVLAAVGVRCVRGSRRHQGVDKGGSDALALLVAAIAPEVPVIVAVDGPRGPAGEVRRGALALAVQSGAAVLPLSVRARRFAVLGRTWDRTQLPWPFARVQVRFAQPLRPPPGPLAAAQSRQWVETMRPKLQAELQSLANAPRSDRSRPS